MKDQIYNFAFNLKVPRVLIQETEKVTISTLSVKRQRELTFGKSNQVVVYNRSIVQPKCFS